MWTPVDARYVYIVLVIELTSFPSTAPTTRKPWKGTRAAGGRGASSSFEVTRCGPIVSEPSGHGGTHVQELVVGGVSFQFWKSRESDIEAIARRSRNCYIPLLGSLGIYQGEHGAWPRSEPHGSHPVQETVRSRNRAVTLTPAPTLTPTLTTARQSAPYPNRR